MQTNQKQNSPANRKVVIGLWAVFLTQFVSFLFINARNIAQPGIINEFDGMALFSWLIVAAFVLPKQPSSALYIVGLAMLLLLLLGIRNAWDMVTFLAVERAHSENKSTEQKQATRRK